MSTDFSKEDVIQNKKQAIKKLNSMLEGFINDPSGQRLKKPTCFPTGLKIMSECLALKKLLTLKKYCL